MISNLIRWFRKQAAALKDVRYPQRRKSRTSRYLAVAALLMVVVTVVALVHGLDDQSAPFPSVDTITSNGSANDAAAPKAGPLELALNAEISEALKTKEWPGLEPSVESVISGPEADPEVRTNCGGTLFPDQALCRWGSKDAPPTLVVIVGDSVALSYAGPPLRRIALDSDNQIQVRAEAMPGCEFTDDLIAYDDQRLVDACTARKQHSIDVINAKQPAIVIIANSYGEKQVVGHDKPMTPREWFESMKRIVAKFKGSTKKRLCFWPLRPAMCQSIVATALVTADLQTVSAGYRNNGATLHTTSAASPSPLAGPGWIRASGSATNHASAQAS